MEKLTKLLPDLSGFRPMDFLDEAISVVVVLILAWVLLRISRRAIRLFANLATRNANDPEDRKRVETLSRVFRYLSSVTIIGVTIMVVLDQVGISIAPILGAAGVVGLAVGFGAQSLVKDFFSGFTILLENQIRQGDVVTIAGMSGAVESVTLRTVKLRGYDGSVHFIPTGKIDTVTNMSMEFGQAAMDIGIAYREDIDAVFELMRQTAREQREDAEFAPRILADLEIAGVDQWADSSVMIKCRIKTKPLEQWAVRRDYLRRLKKTFDANNIEIPFPHVTVYAGQLKSGQAPAMPLSLEPPAYPGGSGANQAAPR
ncbi:MAG: mechanosensitive ion channel family protein [Quisquiliibacterium sp.]